MVLTHLYKNEYCGPNWSLLGMELQYTKEKSDGEE